MKATIQHCCLVAEDQAVIALELEANLEEVGIEIAGPFASCAEASAWIERFTPELAILDLKLTDGTCTTIAATLLGRGVPVIIYSGYALAAASDSELRGVTWLEKPLSPTSLMTVAAQLAPSLHPETFEPTTYGLSSGPRTAESRIDHR
jgi:DNA-binding NtrC family response regulator